MEVLKMVDSRITMEHKKAMRECYIFLQQRKLITGLARNIGCSRNTLLKVLQCRNYNAGLVKMAFELMDITEADELELTEHLVNRFKAQQSAADNEYYLSHSKEYNKDVELLTMAL